MKYPVRPKLATVWLYDHDIQTTFVEDLFSNQRVWNDVVNQNVEGQGHFLCLLKDGSQRN
jgi:hypothetical protein